MVRDSLRHFYENKPNLVPIMKDLLKHAHFTYQEYKNYLAAEKTKAEKERVEWERSMAEKEASEVHEKALGAKRKSMDFTTGSCQGNKIGIGQGACIFKSLTGGKQVAVDNDAMNEIRVAQVMLQGAIKCTGELQDLFSKTKDLVKKVAKNNTPLIMSLMLK